MILKGKRILVQYSGGKDSTACIIKMIEEGAYVEAIHFFHKFGYDLPTVEAKRICCEYNIEIHVIDVTEQIEELFLSGFDKRPCRYCKGLMDSITAEFAVKHNFEYICVGDTANDTALIERLKDFDRNNLTVNRYFNKSVKLPEGISVIRPMITYDNDAVFEYLHKRSVEIRRNNDTGDKYFEYSREGCPLQFKDYGVSYSRHLMEQLKKANTLCSEFATKNGIKASLHLPSEMIVTIPKGYEEQCRQYLIEKGFRLKKNFRIRSIFKRYLFSVEVYPEILDTDKIADLFLRFMERISEKSNSVNIVSNTFFIKSDNAEINVRIIKNEMKVVGDFSSLRFYNQDLLDSLFLELFHTYNFSIVYIDDYTQIEDSNVFKSISNSRCISSSISRDRIIRSSAIDQIGEDDIAYLNANKIYTVIDLRNERKCDDALVKRLAENGIKYRYVPFIGNNSFCGEKNTDSSMQIIESYLSLLDEYENINDIFEAIAENDDGVLFFCKHGRDRTGIISVILNLLANKTREEIIMDYVVSDLFLHTDKFQNKIYDYSPEVPLGFISMFLGKYQSAGDYLELIGVKENSIKRIISKMGG